MNTANTSDKSRIKAILKYTKLSKNAFGISIGDKNGMRLTHIENGRNTISEKLARDIVNRYPIISYEWILSGHGFMVTGHQTFGERLKTILEYKGISAYNLSIRLGVNQATISYYKSGKLTPKVITMDKIAEVLAVNKNWLETGSGEMLVAEYETSDNLQVTFDVKEIREYLGLTQQEFAEKIGVSRNTIINYEKTGIIPESKKNMLQNLISTAP